MISCCDIYYSQKEKKIYLTRSGLKYHKNAKKKLRVSLGKALG